MDYEEEFSRLVDEKKFDEAWRVLNKLAPHANDNPFYYANMGWVLNEMERYDEAIVYLNKGLLAFGDDSWVYNQIGYSYHCKEEYAHAIEYYLKAMELGKDDAWIHMSIGYCYCDIDEYDVAIDYFENALMEIDDDPMLFQATADCYMQFECYDIASEYLKKAIIYNPIRKNYIMLLKCYYFLVDNQSALQILEDDKVDLDDKWRYEELGFYKACEKQYREAIDCIYKAMEYGKVAYFSYETLGDCYRYLYMEDKYDDKDQIYRFYDIAYDLVCNEEDEDEIIDAKIQLLIKLNRLQEAKVMLEAISSSQLRNRALGLLYQELGMEEQYNKIKDEAFKGLDNRYPGRTIYETIDEKLFAFHHR